MTRQVEAVYENGVFRPLEPVSAEAHALIRGHFQAELASKDFQVFAITDLHYGQAERLVLQYAFGHRLRSLDALQLAVALDLKDQAISQQIVAADKDCL